MRKKIKYLSRKFLTSLMTFVILFQMFAPTLVLAVSYEDANNVTIGGSSSIDANTFNYTNGSVTITRTRNDETININTSTFAVQAGDVVKITLTPNANYVASLRNEGNGASIALVENSYEFTINSAPESTLSLTPTFINGNDQSDSPIENLKFDFTINGESFTNVSIGDDLLVSENFNMETIEELYITKIVDGENRTYTYADEEYSYDLLNSEGNHILETFFIKRSNNYTNLRFEAHADGILGADLNRYNKTQDDYFGIYVTGVKLIKSGFKGVEITTNVMPDNYDFTVWNGVDLGETTINKPGTVTAYYGEDTISLNSQTSSPIKKIELIEEKGVPSSAVEINSENGTIKVLSNYYNQIPVKVELEDGTIGYVTINRIGIFIGDLNKDQDTFYHGAFNNVNGNLNVQTDKQRLVAVFYHDSTKTHEDYDLIVNIVYKDGTTETRMATGVGSIPNSDEEITGSDYILWSGDSIENSIQKVFVTAVEKGAITDEATFGGATFGSGAGVVWEKE